MSHTAIGAMVPRRRVTVTGEIVTVRSFTKPWVRTDADLDDGTGTVTLRFVGRSQVPGVVPGQRMLAHGTAALDEGGLVISNPIYSFVTEG